MILPQKQPVLFYKIFKRFLILVYEIFCSFIPDHIAIISVHFVVSILIHTDRCFNPDQHALACIVLIDDLAIFYCKRFRQSGT